MEAEAAAEPNVEPAADPATEPASFGEWLGTRTDEQLHALLQARPDVSVPPPPDFEVLARRLASSASVGRAMERVDRFGLELLEILTLLPGTTDPTELARVTGVEPAVLDPALDRLRDLGLVWGGSTLTLPRGVADEVGPHPLGLGRTAVELVRDELTPDERAVISTNLGLGGRGAASGLSAVFSDAARVDALLDETDEPGRQLLAQLSAGAPIGSTGNPVAVPPLAEARTAVGRLLARGLLMPAGGDLVELPREVALRLRARESDGSTSGIPTGAGELSGVLAGRLHPHPPGLGDRTLPLADVDAASASAAAEFLRRLDALLARWEESPPVLTRNGGLPVRELRAAAKDLDLPVDTVAVVAELAHAASLVAETAGMETSVVPTEYVDAWRTLGDAERWAVVADGWLSLEAYPGLATTRQPRRQGPLEDAEPFKPLPVFSWDLRRGGAVAARREILDVFASTPSGTVVDAAAVRERLVWQGPRRKAHWWDAVVDWTLSESELLGITGRAALSSAGRALLADGRAAAAAALDVHLPPPVDHVLIQGDLTAVAPGPLEPVLAREIALVADVESAGAATVFRFSESSVRRALDAGWSGADVQALIGRAARGTVPQSLTYLIDDVARRHGRLRVGAVSSYLRCDDPALLAEVVAAKRTTSVHLRQVAPTVAVSASPLDRVLEVLRTAGYAPASEGADGAVRIERAPVERVPVPVRRAGGSSGGVPRDHLSATVLRLRRAQSVESAARRGLRRPSAAGAAVRTPGEILARLGEVVANGGAVEIDYVNLEGRSGRRVVHPLLLSGGYLTAYDEQNGERRTFAVSRISALVGLEDAG